MKKYCIECRYQKITRNGVEWTDWFVSLTDNASEDKNYLLERISDYIKRDKAVHSKLKHEYKVSEYVDPPEVHAFQKMYSRRKNANVKKSPRTIKKSKAE